MTDWLGEHLQKMGTAAGPEDQPFVITRVYSVPLERMWDAWTQRDHLKQWFGPKGITISHSTLDVRPGGVFHYCMRCAPLSLSRRDGRLHPSSEARRRHRGLTGGVLPFALVALRPGGPGPHRILIGICIAGHCRTAARILYS